jgi:hypothetical protein
VQRAPPQLGTETVGRRDAEVGEKAQVPRAGDDRMESACDPLALGVVALESVEPGVEARRRAGGPGTVCGPQAPHERGERSGIGRGRRVGHRGGRDRGGRNRAAGVGTAPAAGHSA